MIYCDLCCEAVNWKKNFPCLLNGFRNPLSNNLLFNYIIVITNVTLLSKLFPNIQSIRSFQYRMLKQCEA